MADSTAEPRTRVTMITIRVDSEPGVAPMIVAREHIVWPSSSPARAARRMTASRCPDDVLGVVGGWLRECAAHSDNP